MLLGMPGTDFLALTLNYKVVKFCVMGANPLCFEVDDFSINCEGLRLYFPTVQFDSKSAAKE